MDRHERDLIAFRQHLHKNPELSGQEENTAQAILGFLGENAARKVIHPVGGTGIILHYDSGKPGPLIMIRADIDALPIEEEANHSYASENVGVAHLCGHDGHTAILAGLAMELDDDPPDNGQVVLLFQPSEENGQGAHNVLNDKAFNFRPDLAFALHNLPGFDMGELICREDIFACASTGMKVRLQGRTSHAAEPHLGISPERCIRRMLRFVEDKRKSLPEGTIITTTHIRMGEKVFGISPGLARIFFTLRSRDTKRMEDLFQEMDRYFHECAREENLSYHSEKTEYFPATRNSSAAVSSLKSAASACGMPIREINEPFGWSEDFGWYTQEFPGALFGLGSGNDHVPLHHPSFDFPDALLPVGIKLFKELIQECLRLPSSG